ncbi:hypothetical protein Rsub_12639 [Raphidocelis subcapitata]|uniref:Transcription factor Pcc1 n=1 Tax=Raphidocelis subcapitata TaxID=307507 RepID=A0A2V0PJP5_9CHLO|nr:hypothetical protein Rsub_12639 [Raphidocelis subcapitata]|eukprot:GBF99946.1 hypothetical protein Rsub_12639 [Raphidocelis subcapitata]
MATIAPPAASPASVKPAASKPAGNTSQQQGPQNELAYTFNGTVELATPEVAAMVCSALDVDPELNPGLVSRELRTEGRTLHIAFAASELRLLRAAVGTFYDLLALAVRTAERFGGGASGADAGAPEAAGAVAAAGSEDARAAC